MRILSVRRRTVSLLFFSAAFMIVLNYFLESGGGADIVDIWVSSHIERACVNQTSGSIENTGLKSLAGKVIAIDPGHGGIDNGALGYGRKEKDINLAIAAKIAEELRVHNAAPVLTRAADVDYYTRGKGGKRNDILRRAQIIKESGAQIFVSVHCNATNDPSWSGAQVFYNSKIAANKELAEIMQQALKNFPPGNKRQSKQDSHIFLLKSLNIPGVLIETGFISNRKDALSLAEEEYQRNLAKSVVTGLAHYFERGGSAGQL